MKSELVNLLTQRHKVLHNASSLKFSSFNSLQVWIQAGLSYYIRRKTIKFYVKHVIFEIILSLVSELIVFLSKEIWTIKLTNATW